jgi:hypothetical protein
MAMAKIVGLIRVFMLSPHDLIEYCPTAVLIRSIVEQNAS